MISVHPIIFFFSNLDPCDRVNCNGSNVVCQIVYETGKPFCACERGFRGDPNVGCGKQVFFVSKDKIFIISANNICFTHFLIISPIYILHSPTTSSANQH